MVTRVDLPLAILASGSLLTIVGASVLGPSSPVSIIVPVAMIPIIFGYAAYWAFSISRALTVSLYRNQALGVGLVAVVSALFVELGGTFLGLPFGFIGSSTLIIYLFSFGVFYWVDASMLAVRRADPAFRDTMHWSGVRWFLWSLLFAAALSVSIISVLFGLIGFPTGGVSTPQATPLQNSLLVNPVFNFLGFFVPVLAPLVSGGIFLPAAVRRTKDLIIRRHLRWFGVFLLIQVIGLITSLVAYNGNLPSTPFIVSVPLVLIDCVGGYCLYRSARALARVYED